MKKIISSHVRIIVMIQSIYFLLFAAWPIIDAGSFMLLTGPKTDIWLLKTVSVLSIAIGITLMYSAYSKTIALNILILAFTSALAFFCIDLYYVLKGTISPVYLADGCIELVFMIAYLLYKPDGNIK